MTPEARASAAVYACRRGHSTFVYCTGCVTDAIRAAAAAEREACAMVADAGPAEAEQEWSGSVMAEHIAAAIRARGVQ